MSGTPRRPGQGERVIADAFAAYLADQGWKDVGRLAAVGRVWEEAAGAKVAAHLVPVALRGETLVVAAADTAWAAQLAFVAPAILGRLATLLGAEAPTRVEARRRPGLPDHGPQGAPPPRR